MAEFLTTNGISNQLEEIIKGAGTGRLLLISPYLKFNRLIKGLIEDQAESGKAVIQVVYRQPELRSEETEWLADNDVSTYVLDNLHAKCYMNDSHAIIGSMNLYDYSQQNNYEMGLLISAEEDRELYQKVKDEAERILRRSQRVRLEVTPVPDLDIDDGPALPSLGFCLRCGEKIPFAPDRPYCNSDYRSWARFKNEEYAEKRCHACGDEHGTSMAKPMCISCYRKYRGTLSAATG